MKIHKTVNPVAYENTYYLEGEKHLIVVDPGSHWEAIRQTIEKINKPICAILLTHAHYDHIMSLDLVRETFRLAILLSISQRAKPAGSTLLSIISPVSLATMIWQMWSQNLQNTPLSFTKNTN